jgi:hypothetical protein
MVGRTREVRGSVCWIAWLILLAAVAGLGTPAGADVTYIYDELGRLRAVFDPSQTDGTALYSYDAVGNILSISRQPASQVAIIEFLPKSGPVGSTVRIQGTGFSATPGQNTVTFNGTGAAVSTATANELVVTVPAGATTGALGVTVSGGGSATSSEPFTVTAGPLAPTITSFTPTLGAPGTPVDLTGTNFDLLASANAVTFAGNGLRAAVTSATATSLAAKVPPGAVSGRIKVATPLGSAVSTQDFFVPVGAYTVADVVTTVRMAIGETQAISIPTATKIALVVFDGTAGQAVSFRFTGTQITSGVISVHKPDGTALFSPISISLTNGFVDTKTLPTTGTYTLVIDPDGSLTGSVTLTLYNVVDVAGSIAAGGAAVPVTITTPGQNARLTFSGTAGQRVTLRRTNSTVPNVAISILRPDGTTLAGPDFGEYLLAVELPATGTYTALGDPLAAQTGNFTLTLYDAADVTGTIAIGGAAVPVSIAVAGQNARLTFSGTTGQRVSLSMSSLTIPSSWVSIQKPDGSALVTVNVGAPTGFIDVQTLPSTGTYTIFLDPIGANTGNMTFTLYEVPADLAGSITPGGAAVPISLGTPGQNATLTFSGTSGQRISLRMTAVTFTRAFVSIKNPDVSTLVAPTFVGTAGAFIDLTTLAQTGTYSIFVNPDIQYTGSMTLTLYDVPADVTGTLTINDPAVTVVITTPGQNGSYTFSGTASQQATVRITSNTIGVVTVALKKPDGTQLTASTSGAASFNLATQTLPTTGTYTVTVNPDGFNIGSLNLSVTSP